MRHTVLVIMIFAFALPLLAQADTITISQSIPFAEDSGATDAVKAECKFETRVPEYLKKAAKKNVDVVLSKDPLEAAEGKVLFLEVTNMFGLGGGADYADWLREPTMDAKLGVNSCFDASSTCASLFLVTLKCLFNTRRVMNDPPLNNTVIDRVS